MFSNARGLQASFTLANVKGKKAPFFFLAQADVASLVAQLAQLPLLNLPSLRRERKEYTTFI